MNRLFVLSIAVLMSLGAGIYVGHKVTQAGHEKEIAEITARMNKANEETRFWQTTLRGLAEGGQLEGVELR